ncbi:putative enoyl-CoA hydratase echA6 [Tsuneonella dongtanensis]|uniref:Putative enoyl-CoA hydratase echA6 n=1 Tax=Tsuneonella dongtanensis TaxID=692370 RepID=A0A1B2AGW6_9SPHN|nr:crotonase/enoyl-CoA hydratase family protein [Tsuneonella dongtanensis]ANY21387.1 putative enoyl-CoA hydratase echA6 [Tsuneonella dongtanensis]
MNMRDNDRVRIELGEDGVAQVRLIRADKMNALDGEMFARLIEAGQALHDMKGLRAVVLSGEGRAFCAGLDLSSLGRDRSNEPPLTERTYGNSNGPQQVAMQWRKLPVPVIAAVHGVCFGGGLQIASGADIRVVAPDTRMAIMEMRWGLVPDMGGYALWRGMIRDDFLRELTYTNREFTGEEAYAFGLATHVDADPLTKATAIAATIADRSPHAIRGAKRLANAMHDKATNDLLMDESLEQMKVMRTRNQIEAVMAGMEKRPARYEDV